MISKFKTMVLVIVLLLSLSINAFSQQSKSKGFSKEIINVLDDAGFSLVETKDYYAFFEHKCSLGKNYMIGLIKTNNKLGDEITVFSVEFKTKIPEMTKAQQEKFLELLNSTAPKGLYLDLVHSQNELFLTANHIEYIPIEEATKQSLIIVCKNLIEFACLTDMYVDEYQKEFQSKKPFGIAGSGEKESEAIKKFKDASKQFQIDIPNIPLPKR